MFCFTGRALDLFCMETKITKLVRRMVLTTGAGYEHKKEDGKLISVVSSGQIMMPSVLETFSLLCLQTSGSSGFANLNF